MLRGHDTYAIYWDPGDGFPAGFEAGVDQYFEDVASASGASDNEYSVLTQYYDSTGPGMYQSTFGGSLVDTDPYPANNGTSGCPPAPDLPAGYTACLTDQQVRDELSSVIASQGWPQSAHAIYFVFLPAGMDECFSGPDGYGYTGGCADSTFCSYHSYFGSGQPPLYAVMPWADVPGCQTGESPNGTGGDDALDDQLSLISHEHAETITDPYGTSWYDANGNEVADDCTNPDEFGPLSGLAPDQYNETFGADDYILQENFSNDGDGCRARYEARFDAPTKPVAARPVAFSALPPSGSPGIVSYTWDFGDGTTGSGATTSHTYATAGQYTVTLSTVDSDGGTDSVSHTVAVSTVLAQFNAPAQANAGQPVTFDGSPSLGAVTSYSWDFGDGTTASGISPSHTYAEPDAYTVTLTVTDKAGDQSSTSQAVTVGPASPPNNGAQSTSTPSTTSSTATSDSESSSSSTSVTTTTITATAPPASTSTSTSAPPSPGPKAPPPPPPRLRATLARTGPANVLVRGELTVAHTGETIACPKGAGACVVGVTLTHVTALSDSFTNAFHASPSLTLSSARLVIPTGHAAEISLDLSPAGARLLRGAGRLRADLEIIAGVTGGASTTQVLPLDLTAPRTRPR